MVLADIQQKKADERKREKRLVHLTNALSRDFVASLRLRLKAQKINAEYLVKSFLEFVFFESHKEIKEISEELIRHFMLEFAPRKLVFGKETAKNTPDLLIQLINFLAAGGYIRNSAQLVDSIKESNKQFSKLVTEKANTAPKMGAVKSPLTPIKTEPEIKAGRNDPCPCGSGKKYKKCCINLPG